MSNAVNRIPAAPSAQALQHFEAGFGFETDCWDTHDALQQETPGFVLVDARSPAAYARGHVPGAVNIPHGKLIESRLAKYPESTLFVVYYAGPHYNGREIGRASCRERV